MTQKKKNQVTIHDIARELNTTASTVSRALQGHPRISESTKKAVKELAKKWKYQPNIVASNLRKGKSNTIGVIVPHINRYFFSSVIAGIEEVANKAGYNIIICQTYEKYDKECSNVKILLNSRVDGILASLAKETKTYEHFEMIKEMGIPLIFFDRVINEMEVSKVILDDFAGAFKAVEHLINCGSKKIAHFAGPTHVSIYKNRLEGYLEALKKHKLKTGKELIFQDTLAKESGYEAVNMMIENKNLPDAIFSASDFSALGAILSLKSHKIKVPGEVAVVGFANEPYTTIMEPALSSVEQHAEEIGQVSAKLIFEEFKSKGESFSPKKIIINPDLKIRESSMK